MQPSLTPGLWTVGNILACVNPGGKMMVATPLQNSTAAPGGGGAAVRCDTPVNKALS